MMDIAAASHLGHARRRNEDCCFHAPAHGLSVVADGVGGQGDGAWASQRVVDLFCDRIISLNGSASQDVREVAILDGLQFAHGQMRTENNAGGDKPSGTTIAGIWAPDGAAGLVTAFNVGDSPVFHFTKGSMVKVSRDHSVYQLWLDGGRVGKEPGKRMIVQAVGISEQLSPHIVSFPVRCGDAVLICTDGLSGTMEAAQMAKLLAQAKNAQNACDLLLAEALAGAARDNVTVSVCYF
ncbi:MAG: serine/threonine-protein phosphatase [Alphaproteobacteria bacterium]|nr:serine/threonine-protein phosphatase [Alphaproteobacteria bacterium]